MKARKNVTFEHPSPHSDDTDQIRSSYSASWCDAVVVDEKILNSLIKMMSKFGETTDLRVTYHNNSKITFENVSDCSQVENTKAERVTGISISTKRRENRYSTFDLGIFDRPFLTLDASASGPHESVKYFMNEISGARARLTPWYSKISQNIGAISFAIPILFLCGLTIYGDYFSIAPDVSEQKGLGGAKATYLIVFFAIFISVVSLISCILKLCFPSVVIAFGERSGLVQRHFNIRAFMLTSIFIPIIYAFVF